MNNRNQLIGVSLLLVMLILPTSAVAAPASQDGRTPLAKAMGQFLELVSACLFPSTEGLRSGIDPWGRVAPSDETTNGEDIGIGWDPWGSPASPAGSANGDIGALWDPWG